MNKRAQKTEVVTVTGMREPKRNIKVNISFALAGALLAGSASAVIAGASSPTYVYENETITTVEEIEAQAPEVVEVERVIEVEVPVIQTVEVEVPVEVPVEVEVEVPVEVIRYVTSTNEPAEALTGVIDAAVVNNPAIAVKIPNNNAARNQQGLERADVVFEEIVNDNLTRFLAVFHSDLPSHVGPVRSSRTQDIDLISAFSMPVFLHSGANNTVTEQLATAEAAGLFVDGSYLSTSGYWRGTDRPAPHNLYVSVSDMNDRLGAQANSAVSPVFSYTDNPTGLEGNRVEFDMDSVRVDWTWEDGTYVRRQDGPIHTTKDGIVTADNIVVMAVDYGIDPLTPVAQTVGSGDVVVFRNGTRVHGTWSRDAATDPFEFRSESGQVIELARGNTWVEMPRNDTHIKINSPVVPCSLVGTIPTANPDNCIEGE